MTSHRSHDFSVENHKIPVKQGRPVGRQLRAPSPAPASLSLVQEYSVTTEHTIEGLYIVVPVATVAALAPEGGHLLEGILCPRHIALRSSRYGQKLVQIDEGCLFYPGRRELGGVI